MCLVAVLGVLHTGLPSHSHEVERTEAAGDHPSIRADHHQHGTQLIEQAERVQSAPVHLDAPPFTPAGVTFPTVNYTGAYHSTPIRPQERAPPPGAARAPPQFI
jgi:hypothetical protein